MNWNLILNWGYGFLIPLVAIAIIAAAIGEANGYMWLFDHFNFDLKAMWCGFWLFISLTIIAIIATVVIWG